MTIANRALRARVYWARRLVQTPRTFTNWPDVFKHMALGRGGRGPDTLTFRTRTGVRIDTPNRPGARVPVYEIFAEDCYRLEWLLGPLLREPLQVVDIGGHVGTFSVRLAKLHPKATIATFEPSPTTASFLRRNVEQNGVADRVTVTEAALFGSSGSAVFDDNGAGSGLNGLLAARTVGTGTATEVRTVALDDVVAALPSPPQLVKIDCEGGEYDLVLHSDPASWRSVRRVVIEFHPVAGHGWPELREFFAGVGLTVQDIETLDGYGCAWLSRDPLPVR